MNENFLRVWLRAWALITVVDGIFATVLPVVAYGEPPGRVWQVIASLLLGRGARTAAVVYFTCGRALRVRRRGRSTALRQAT